MIVLKNPRQFNRTVSEKGFSKRAFARHCGISESTLIQISNSKQCPRPDTAKKICEGLQLNFNDIFTIKEKVETKRVVI
ncbi:helix-turn-helix transcriptional regulator [Planococcus sp. ISL-110]|uniref:helix-turn-helix transcriptional regulator n=1 Tax=Planococcus sp. ISL-110 TaxID=2819167 RepID=UPI001BEA9DB6|nr:helix-turn-helix transcriptional regulator [Planococcus sp. ISL-110]MBT2569851.1 helix-turn-helix transcriptional regulator [Planococcus sp. ISL-110]